MFFQTSDLQSVQCSQYGIWADGKVERWCVLW